MASCKVIYRELSELSQALHSTFAGQVFLPEEPMREDEEDNFPVLQFAIKPSDG